MATAIDLFEHYDETNQLSRIDHFIAREQEQSPRLTEFELAKADDLREDVVWLQERDRRDRAERTSWLAHEYIRFEEWWGRPGRPTRGLEPAAASPPPPPPPGLFDAEYQLLDRLSVWYGGRYRGVIIFNYRNALLGGLAALGAHTLGHSTEIMLGGIEIALFALILGFYLVGRTPTPAFRGTSRAKPLIARRWHQRWLEYRLLAERFRYAALLAPVASERLDTTWRRLMGDQVSATTWHDRFFLWRLSEAPEPVMPDALWFDRLLAIMRYQAWYHSQAGARRHNAVRRLEWVALGSLIAALALLTVRVLLVVYIDAKYGVPALGTFGSHLLDVAAAISFIGGWCTLLAASVHGMLSTAELKRLAETSSEASLRIGELCARIEARRTPTARPADVRDEAEAFCRLVTEEASGWRALLLDKDVPVPH